MGELEKGKKREVREREVMRVEKKVRCNIFPMVAAATKQIPLSLGKY